MNKLAAYGITGVATAVVFAIVLFPMIIWCGYVESILWGWFVVPLGVKALSVSHACGLALTVGAIRLKANSKGHEVDTKDALLKMTVGHVAMLGVGWVFHWAMIGGWL